jgi:hypothetical protein
MLILPILPASARLSVDYATIEVNGETIEFPIGNPGRTNDVYYLKKALNGDKEAREVFLGGASSKWFYIGEYEPLWLYVDKVGEKVVKP